jgi:hypothetical protein
MSNFMPWLMIALLILPLTTVAAEPQRAVTIEKLWDDLLLDGEDGTQQAFHAMRAPGAHA